MTGGAASLVSIVIPCCNEREHIVPCLDSILASDFLPNVLEVLVIDGMSDDGTAEIACTYATTHPVVRVVQNPERTVSYALNRGIREARGEVIVRMDTHVTYSPTYLRTLVDALVAYRADNVGGLITTMPGDDSAVAHAIALALSHWFGVGNSYFRIGTPTPEPRWVDTVPFGCFRRQVFERVGLFDEDLVRNQDDEFNLRLVRGGGRV